MDQPHQPKGTVSLNVGPVMDAISGLVKLVTVLISAVLTLASKVGILVFVGTLIGTLVWGAHRFGVESELKQWIADAIPFTLACLIVLLVSLLLVYISQKIRNQAWFDKDGAAQELSLVRNRIGTEKEKPWDSAAVSVQYGTTTILIAVVIYTFFSVVMVPGG